MPYQLDYASRWAARLEQPVVIRQAVVAYPIGVPGFTCARLRRCSLVSRYDIPIFDTHQAARLEPPVLIRQAVVAYPIGVPGFEPGTSATRTQRSTGLSHTPYCRPGTRARMDLRSASGRSSIVSRKNVQLFDNFMAASARTGDLCD